MIDFCRVGNDEIIDAIERKIICRLINSCYEIAFVRYDFKIYQVTKNLKVERTENLVDVVGGYRFLATAIDSIFIP